MEFINVLKETDILEFSTAVLQEFCLWFCMGVKLGL
jgi:hypothetical protein